MTDTDFNTNLKNLVLKSLKDDCIYMCNEMNLFDLRRKIKVYKFSEEELRNIYKCLELMNKCREVTNRGKNRRKD